MLIGITHALERGEMEEPPDRPYRYAKTSLKNVAKNDADIAKLTEATLRANSIMIHTLQLYLLRCCDKGVELPTLDRQFATLAMKVLCKAPS